MATSLHVLPEYVRPYSFLPEYACGYLVLGSFDGDPGCSSSLPGLLSSVFGVPEPAGRQQNKSEHQ